MAQLALAGTLADLDQIDELFQPRARDELAQRRALAQPYALAFDAAKPAATRRLKRIGALAVSFLNIAGGENLVVEDHQCAKAARLGRGGDANRRRQVEH